MRSRYGFDSCCLWDTSKVQILSAFRTSLKLHARIDRDEQQSVSWH